MKERFKTPVAVFLILLKKENNKIMTLLQKRQNTGYKDGFWDTAASGHVEADESLTEAMIRETQEEIGITVSKNDLKFSGFYYNNIKNKIYCYTYFSTFIYKNSPKIKEPEKCSELQWYDINNLPPNIIGDRKESINNYFNEIYFGEIGW